MLNNEKKNNEDSLASTPTPKLSAVKRKRKKKNEREKLKKNKCKKLINVLYKIFPNELNSCVSYSPSLGSIDETRSTCNYSELTYIDWTKQPHVLDIAGGKGDVAWELCYHRSIATVVIDPMPKRLNENRSKRIFSHAWRSMGRPTTPETKTGNNYVKQSNLIISDWFHKKVKSKAGNSITNQSCDLMRKIGFSQYQCLFNDDFFNCNSIRKNNDEKMTHSIVRKINIDNDLKSNIFIPSCKELPVPPKQIIYKNTKLIVGMHPDQATEEIVIQALKADIPFAIVPCCVYPSLFPNRKLKDGTFVNTLDLFIKYFQEMDNKIQVMILDELPSPTNILVYYVK
jgi:hypothetical protein